MCSADFHIEDDDYDYDYNDKDNDDKDEDDDERNTTFERINRICNVITVR